MNEDLKTYLEEIDLIIDEILEYEFLKNNFLKELKTIASEYEKGKLDFKNYNILKDKILNGKSKEENLDYFNSYIFALLKKIEYLNTQVFSTLYKDNSWENAIKKIDENKLSKSNYKKEKKINDVSKLDDVKPIVPLYQKHENNKTQIIPKINIQKTDIPQKITQELKLEKQQTIQEQKKPININDKKLEIQEQKIIPKKQQTTQEIKKPELKKETKIQEIIIENKQTISEIKKNTQKSPIDSKKTSPTNLQEINNEVYQIENEFENKIIDTSVKQNSKTEDIKEITESVEIINEGKNNPNKKLDLLNGKIENFDDEYDKIEIPIPKQKSKINIPNPRKKSTTNIIRNIFSDDKNKIKNSDDKQIGFKGIINFEFLKDFVKRVNKKEDIISKEMIKGKSILDFSNLKEVDFEKEAKENPTLLVKQANQLKEILNKKKIKIYNPSVLGTISNVTVRKISIMLIDNFPDFFKNFYLTLRYANIKILSNTYINIMVFFSILTSILFGTVAGIIAIYSNNPLMLIISKVFLMALLGMILCAGFMIYYPNMLIKKRIASINTNLPFAVDHMSSIVASGVPPAAMFRLLSDSKEYGDVSLEIEKVSNFVDIFGYDLLTAVKSIATTTPSPQFKEFLDGLVSTIETGGSLKNYLSQKSQEAILSYKLERQKYVETIGTYSDIYTGVLIAAPLFFVSALSLVSVLGGKIGGYDVNTVISFGTYIIIPLLNIAFIIFLETNQPEV